MISINKFLSIVCLLLISVAGYAQFSNFSNRGKEFWVGYGHHQYMEPTQGGQFNTMEMVLYLSTQQDPAVVTVKIEGSGNIVTGPWTRTYTMPAYTVLSIEDPMPTGVTVTKSPACIPTIGPIPKAGTLDCGFNAKLYDNPPSVGGQNGETIFRKKGIHITATNPIVAYAHIYGSAASGATMLMPVETWGYNYTSINSMQRDADDAFSWVFVVAGSDHTKIEITPSAVTRLGKPAGVPFQLRLNKGEIYQFIGASIGTQDGYELTGSTVKSIANDSGQCFPIAVFAGSSRTSGEDLCASGSRDNDIQQMFPQEAWGKRYLTAPMSKSTGASNLMSNVYKVAVLDPATVVKRNGVPLTGLIGGKYYRFQSGAGDYLEADKPVMVAQFMGGDGGPCNSGGSGDPEMVYLSPIEQSIKEIGFYRNTKESIDVQYLTLIIPTNGVNSLQIDGIPFNSIAAANKYSYVHPALPGYTVCIRRWFPAAKAQSFAKSDSAFTAITYGEGGVESYGYNAGTYIFNLNALTTIHNILDTSRTENNFTCTKTPVDLCQWIAYIPTQIIWDVTGVSGIQPNPGRVIVGDGISLMPWSDTATINGKLYYKFCIPGNPFIFNNQGAFSIPDSVKNPNLSICNPWEKFTVDLIVKQKPLASFTVDPITCASDPVQFHGSGSGNGYTFSQWFWEFPSGTPSPDSSQNPTFLFPSPGTTYPVRLSVASDEGCYADTVVNIVIPPNDTTSFTLSTHAICAGSTVTITPGPTGTTMWYWDFGDGIIDSFANGNSFTHTYANPGVFIIKHSIKGTGTCKPTASDSITVYSNPVTSFTTSPSGCLPANGVVNFIGNVATSDSQNVAPYSWNFGDAAATVSNPNTSTLQNPSHIFQNATYNISFGATTVNGCVGDTVVTITFNLQPVLAYPNPPTNVCRNAVPFSVATATVTNGVPGNGVYSGPGTNSAGMFDPSLANIGVNTIWYTYTSSANCIDSISRDITVNPLPVSSFSTSPSGCLTNLNITFNPTSTVPTGFTATYAWDFGDGATLSPGPGSVSHTYSTFGTYNIKIVTTTNAGCSDSITTPTTFNLKPLLVYPPLPAICGNSAPVSVATAGVTNGVPGAGIYSGPGTDPAGNFDPAIAGPGTHTITYAFNSTANCFSSITQTISVSAKPVANFGYPSACLPTDSVQFSDSSFIPTGFTAAYSWNFGEPSSGVRDTSTLQNPLHEYNAEGLYIVKLVLDLNGCMDSTTDTIAVRLQPKLSYPALLPVCANVPPFSIATATPTNGVTGTFKYVGPGTDTLGMFDPAAAGVGTKTIRYIYTTAFGCKDSVSQTITVNVVPVASFSFPTGCLPNGNVQFVNNSSGATSYTWDFGDGSPTSTATAPSHPYTSSGPFNVKLTATSTICLKDTTIPVTVRIQPVLSFPPLAPVCANVPAFSIATGTSTIIPGTPKYSGPGTDSAGIFNPAVAGIGTHTIWYIFTTSLGCIDSVPQNIIVNAVPTASFSAPTGCLPNGNVQFVNNSTGATSYTWNFGDGSAASSANAPSHPYTSSGPFNVKLTAISNICSDDTTISITVRIQPVLTYPPLAAVCANSPAFSIATGTSTVTPGTPKYVGAGTNSAGMFDPAIAGIGTHTIWYIFTTSLGCIDSISQTITVNAVPTASFSAPTGCLPNGNVQFVNNSAGATSYTWNFGDGSAASSANAPSHPYTSSGPFNVKLTATSLGCSKDTTIPITVRIQPILNYPALASVCVNVSPLSIATGTVTNNVLGGITKYRGPGTDSLGMFDPAVAGVGTHTIRYIYTSPLGCSDSLAQNIIVKAVPVASFTYPTNCLANGQVQFIYTGTTPINSFSWNFGEPGSSNNTSTSSTPSPHTYASFDTAFTIKLVVAANGCSDDTSVTTVIRVKPQLSYAALPPICMTSDTLMVDKASVINNVSGNGIYRGPGIIDTFGRFVPSLAGAGPATIWYVYTSKYGCVDSISRIVQVYARPVAVFNVSNANICLNKSVTLTSNSTISSGSITNWYWDYGDGQGDTLTNGSPFTKSYAAIGSYNIKLIAVSNNNCVSLPAIKAIDVRALPMADFDLPPNGGVCMPFGSAQFTNATTIQGEDPSTLTYVWNFGDATPVSNDVDPTHVYNSTAPGATVSLEVISAYSCKDTISKLIAFFKKPIADFIVKPDTLCQGTPNKFTDISTATGSVIASRKWSFGDGTTDTIKNPVKTYSRDGSFKVLLTVSNVQGCSEQAFKVIKVYLQPIVDAGLPFSVPVGQLVTLNPVVNSINLSFAWTPTTGLNAPNILQPSFTATDDITYTLIATGQSGCTARDSVVISVMRPISIPNSFSPNGDGINDTWNLTNLKDYPSATVEVFNRFGQKVFSLYGGAGAKWDGTNNGKPLPVGTYYYVINLRDKINATPYGGYVIILR